MKRIEAGTPSLYTRFIGDPRVKYFDFEVGAYVQDDIRVSKGLTVSPGVRFSTQNIVAMPEGVGAALWVDVGADARRQDDAAGRARASSTIFCGGAPSSRPCASTACASASCIIVNPSYPDPGTEGVVPAANKYLLGDYPLPENLRYSAGIDQAFSPQFRVNALYNYIQQTGKPRGNEPESAGQRRAGRSELRERHRDWSPMPRCCGTSCS